MILNFEGFQNTLKNDINFFPNRLSSLKHINRVKFSQLVKEFDKNGKGYPFAFQELKKRVTKNYFKEISSVQSKTLHYSSFTFPAYRFLLPEILASDWLGIVDWHKYHRDHALHQPLTAYIVHELLNSGDFGGGLELPDGYFLDLAIDKLLVNPLIQNKNTNYLIEYLKYLGFKELSFLNNREIWRVIFYETAFIAAIFHDIGYPWQFINLLESKLDPADYNKTPVAYGELILELYKEKLLLYPFNGYKKLDASMPIGWISTLVHLINQSLIQTHGLPGAIGFLYLNDVIREFPDKLFNPLYQFCIDWAAMAIMMHDLKKIYWGKKTIPENPQLRLALDVDPLSTLLTICDTLQDFKRPSVVFSESDAQNSHIEMQYSHDCDSVSVDLVKDELKITFKCITKEAFAWKLESLYSDEKEIFNPRYGYIDISSLGLKKVSMKVEYQKKV